MAFNRASNPLTYTTLNVGHERQILDEFERRLIPDLNHEDNGWRAPRTPEELDIYYELFAVTAAQDLFIVQSTALGFGVTEDADLHLLLTRQIADDGRHASYMRESVQALTGRDPIDEIQRNVKRQWEIVGDLPRQGFLGWMAFEIEYELYAVPEIVVALRTQKIIDPRLVEWGPEGGADEAFHREFITAWWRRYLSQRTPSVRQEIVGRMLEYDREYRERKASYYRNLIDRMASLGAWNYEQVKVITDSWHRELRDYLFSQPGLSSNHTTAQE
ncbi:MAG TPA: hypothetical protein VMD75_02285 [Candidatus Binataceae bacterium]|nr:hypothetical protein [Candidatus Binataceae bacterium]